MTAFLRLASCDMNSDVLRELLDVNLVGLHWTAT